MNNKNEKKTIILGYKKEKGTYFPIIECTHRTDYFPEGLKFYCAFCKKFHFHGYPEGHRLAHCHNHESPFEETGYILKLKRRRNNEK